MDKINESDFHKKSTTVIINGRPVEVFEKKLSFEDIVIKAIGSYNPTDTTIYTVSYSKNEHEKGLLTAGDVITVRKGLVFNVTQTSRS